MRFKMPWSKCTTDVTGASSAAAAVANVTQQTGHQPLVFAVAPLLQNEGEDTCKAMRAGCLQDSSCTRAVVARLIL